MQQDHVEIKSLQAAVMRGGDLCAGAHDSDPPDKALPARYQRGVKRTARMPLRT